MPEFVKYDNASPFFPGQCFTCGTHEGPFYYLGEAPGYGVVIIHPHCVIELGRYEGMVDGKTVRDMEQKVIDAGSRILELENQLELEKDRQMRVVPLNDAMKTIKRIQNRKKPDAVASGKT